MARDLLQENEERIRAHYDRFWDLLGRTGDEPWLDPDGRPPIMNLGWWANGVTEARAAQIAMVHELASRLGDLEGKRVLDAGCGLAGPALILATEYGAEVDAVNISGRQVEMAKAYLAEHGLSDRVRVQAANAMALPFPDGEFDVVLSLESAHCFADKERFLAEARRVLRPDGRLLLCDIVGATRLPLVRRQPALGLDLVTSGDWRELLAAAGFEVETGESIGRSVYPGYRRWLRRTAGKRRAEIGAGLSLPRPFRGAAAWALELAYCRSVLPVGSLLRLRDYALFVTRRP